MASKRIFISADHGLALIYFLQSDLVSTLLDAGIEIIILTDGAVQEQIQENFGRAGLIFESLRLKKAQVYAQTIRPAIQWWLHFLRRAGASRRINLEAVDSYILKVEAESESRRRILFPIMRVVTLILRFSRFARQALMHFQSRFNPHLYKDLFDRYQPELVVASTPGWRLDRYLLREAAELGISTAAVIVGWDNTSSYSLPGAHVAHIICWSKIQKQELVLGSDWDADQIYIGGIPSYDGYFNQTWVIPHDQYFQLHGLNPARKLISYAASFVSFSPNIQNIEALAVLVSSDDLVEPSQLLIRLHPNHFADVPRFAAERKQIQALVDKLPNVFVVEPIPISGAMDHYSGEDMPEKTSMMAYSDVFTTVYSTMVVEASVHGRPVVSACINSSVGWPGKFTLHLSLIGGWPTHSRFRESNSGRVAYDREALKNAINYYLENPLADAAARQQFIKDECTYIDGSAGKRTGEYILSLI